MALTLGPLRDVPVHQTTESLYYRTAFIPEAGDPDPLYVRPNFGRWPTNWTLYTATSEPVAWAEYCRNHPDDVEASDVTGGIGITGTLLTAFAGLEVDGVLPLRALYRLTFGFERIADLTSPWAEECLRKAGFDPASFYADEDDGYGDCPELAGLSERLDWEAMRVPSAAWQRPDGRCLPVFDSGRARLLAVEPVVRAASPTVATAVATAYPSGRRPPWLGAAP